MQPLQILYGSNRPQTIKFKPSINALPLKAAALDSAKIYHPGRGTAEDVANDTLCGETAPVEIVLTKVFSPDVYKLGRDYRLIIDFAGAVEEGEDAPLIPRRIDVFFDVVAGVLDADVGLADLLEAEPELKFNNLLRSDADAAPFVETAATSLYARMRASMIEPSEVADRHVWRALLLETAAADALAAFGSEKKAETRRGRAERLWDALFSRLRMKSNDGGVYETIKTGRLIR